MPRGFQGESVAQEARGGSRAAVERGRAAASRSFQTSPMEDSSRFQQGSRETEGPSSFDLGNTTPEALTYDQFMTATGRTETNPYGDQGFFSRVFGVDPSKINYAANTPGGIATLNKVNALAYDQYLNPRDARGNIRGMLREGSPTQYGTVAYDPSQATDFGIAGALPLVGPMLQRATRRSGLTIFDDYMGDLGNELEAFPEGSVAAAPAAQAAQTGAVSDVFEPFTTDPDVRNPESYFADINTRPQETPVTPGFTRPDDAMPTVSEVILGDLQGPPAFIETGRSSVRSVSRGGQPLEEVTGRLDYPGTANDRDAQGLVVAGTMRSPRNVAPSDNQRYVTVDGRIYDRQLDAFLPGAPAVQQGIGTGDPGSASITVNPQSQSPEYVAPDEPIDLLSDILAPDGSILPGVMDSISSGQPRQEVDPRTGRIPGTSGVFDFPSGGFPDPRVSGPQFTPQQIQRANENNAATQRRAQLMAQGMSANAAMMQAEREKIRARAARLGLGQ